MSSRNSAAASRWRANCSDDSPNLGWIRVQCHSDVMAGWMLRAITMENVAVRSEGRALDLPAAPHFRLDKEIKNVVTVVAKTCHYWMGHILANRRSTSRAVQLTQSQVTVARTGLG